MSTPELYRLSEMIAILEGATVVARINRQSAALDDAHRHLGMYPETVVRLTR